MTYDLAIIGGGPAGYTAAELAGKNGLKTILFEKNALGGVCLNEGCIPTKTLLYSAKVYNTAKTADKYGVSCENTAFDLPKIIARKAKVVRKLVAGIRAKMTEAGVEVVVGEAHVIEGIAGQARNDSPAIADLTRNPLQTIELLCNDQIYTAGKVILCTGSETVVPPIPGLRDTAFWTSREALENKEVPDSLVIIGGGVIGIEFATFFNTLGTKVTVVEMADEILGGMDKELSALLRAELTKKGIDFHLSTKVVAVSKNSVEIEKDGAKQSLETAQILLSVGRRPTLSNVKVNEYMQTEDPNIYACGDVTGFSLLAHTAVREAEVAVKHILAVTSYQLAVTNYQLPVTSYQLLCCITSRAAEEWQTPDVRSFSLGDLHALSDAMHNPAQMAIAGKREAGLSVLNRFQMSELNTGTLYAKLPNQWLDVGAKVSVFGYSDYQLTQVQAGFAKQIFADFAIGVNGTVANENSILEEASTTFFTTGIGIYWHFSKQFDWAFLVENALNTLPDNPIKFFGGCNYKPIEFATIALEGSYDKTNHFNLSIGLEYEILKQFILRSGVTTDTGTPSFGIGYRWSRWQADIGFALHPELGTNSMIGIRTTF